jgi:DNA (cytosine-5)-methyltransferase 1
MNVLDLFSGIGGFSLGLERAGMRTVAFCEIEPFCRRVLAKHWPTVPCYDDVRTLTADRLAADGLSIEVICGGFPCQDVSLAGARVGLGGERSGLWAEYARLIRELRPRFAIVENTPGLLSLGMGKVLGDMAEVGYDSEWHSISAAALGADHERDRVWIVAYPHGTRIQPYDICRREQRKEEMGSHAADSDGTRQLQPQGAEREKRGRACNCPQADDADADSSRCARRSQAGAIGENVGIIGAWVRSLIDSASGLSGEHWDHQPVLGRGLHGVPNRLDRVGALGNAVIPQIPEIIGRAIMSASRS